MKKPKIFNVFSSTYGVNPLVISRMEKQKVRPYLKKKYKIGWEYGDGDMKAGCVMSFNTYPFHVLWLSDLDKSDFIPKLAHEVFHHVLRVCDTRNIPTIPEINGRIVDEAAAYLMEFYMREILEKLK